MKSIDTIITQAVALVQRTAREKCARAEVIAKALRAGEDLTDAQIAELHCILDLELDGDLEGIDMRAELSAAVHDVAQAVKELEAHAKANRVTPEGAIRGGNLLDSQMSKAYAAQVGQAMNRIMDGCEQRAAQECGEAPIGRPVNGLDDVDLLMRLRAEAQEKACREGNLVNCARMFHALDELIKSRGM